MKKFCTADTVEADYISIQVFKLEKKKLLKLLVKPKYYVQTALEIPGLVMSFKRCLFIYFKKKNNR